MISLCLLLFQLEAFFLEHTSYLLLILVSPAAKPSVSKGPMNLPLLTVAFRIPGPLLEVPLHTPVRRHRVGWTPVG